jgi:UDP-glucuronate 4-epimerase
MKALVTGAAGFIGRNLAERLLVDGHTVRGVDSITEYYDTGRKQSNMKALGEFEGFEAIEADLRDASLECLLEGVDVVFHQAGQPGVRASWAEGFDGYLSHNVLATQRLLEASRSADLQRFVFASSSSIYGNAARYPADESDVPAPFSPYGVTKLAAEHLCSLYGTNWGVPTVSLRYFTVYGPGQRPDMAIYRLLEAAGDGPAFPVYGDGSQVRDFTFVSDVIEANIAAAERTVPPGTVMNIAGGSSISLQALIGLVEEVLGRPVALEQRDPQAGDVKRTGGSTDRARELLGWKPRVSLADGVAEQAAWHAAHSATSASF